MVTLSDAGWSPPRIAAHLGCYPQTVRDLLQRLPRSRHRPSTRSAAGRPPTTARRGRVDEDLRECSPRTAPGPAGNSAGPSRAGHRPRAAAGPPLPEAVGAGYRRTAPTLKHKQDPAKAERAGQVLANLKAKAVAGSVALYYLDECGFAPTLPVGYSWCLPGRRKLVRYEAPQGRRVNALAAYRPYGRSPRLDVFTAERTWDSYDLIGFLKALPWSKAPRVVVLDNAGFHTSKVIRQARRAWPRRGSICTSCRRTARS